MELINNYKKSLYKSLMINLSDNQHTSGRQLIEKVDCFSSLLSSLGISKSKRIAFISDSNPDWIIIFLSVTKLEAVFIPIDISQDDEDILSKIQMAKPHYIISGIEINYIKDNFTKINYYNSFVKNNYCIYENIEDNDLSDLKCILMNFSSGTGGKEKLIMHSENSLNSAVEFYIKSINNSHVSNILSILPLSTIYSLAVCLACIASGKKIVFADPKLVNLKEVNLKHEIDIIPAVPILVEKIHDAIFKNNALQVKSYRALFMSVKSLCGYIRRTTNINIGRFIFRKVHNKVGPKLKLILSGGATLNRKVLIDMYQIGFTILEGYGLTETAGIVTLRANEYTAFGSAGKPIQGIQISINSSDQSAGEILIKSDRLMLGYYNDSESTNNTIINGWIKTGDIGFYDQHGNIHLKGRIKDVIIFSDESKCLPEEIERHYQSIPGIKEFAIIGTSSTNHSGDCISMVIVKHICANSDDIRNQVTQKSKCLDKKYKVKSTFFIKSLPRNKLGKLCRSKIIELISEEII